MLLCLLPNTSIQNPCTQIWNIPLSQFSLKVLSVVKGICKEVLSTTFEVRASKSALTVRFRKETEMPLLASSTWKLDALNQTCSSQKTAFNEKSELELAVSCLTYLMIVEDFSRWFQWRQSRLVVLPLGSHRWQEQITSFRKAPFCCCLVWQGKHFCSPVSSLDYSYTAPTTSIQKSFFVNSLFFLPSTASWLIFQST